MVRHYLAHFVLVKIKHKFKEWLKRYFAAEIIGTITAVGFASIAHVFYTNYILIAYIGSLGEVIGFYSTIFIQQLIIAHKSKKNKHFSLADLYRITTRIILEFGPAELIDGLLLRPLFMYLFPLLLKNFTIGILLGKIAGDITFYLLVILSYEIKKGVLKNKCE